METEEKSVKILTKYFSDVLDEIVVETLWAEVVDEEKGSFNYSIDKNKIHIKPYATKRIQDDTISEETQDATLVRQRLRYFMRRHRLSENEMTHLIYHYKNIINSRILLERAYKEFVKDNRRNGKKATEFIGQSFLQKFQEYIIILYRQTHTGKILPEGYPKIL